MKVTKPLIVDIATNHFNVQAALFCRNQSSSHWINVEQAMWALQRASQLTEAQVTERFVPSPVGCWLDILLELSSYQHPSPRVA